jgi:Leucine-rich repeat (LRR) protein
MGALQYLYLNNNSLTEVPTSMGTLSHLTRLYLNNNQLTGKLPNSFAGLSSISEFYINENNISELPDAFTSLTTI